MEQISVDLGFAKIVAETNQYDGYKEIVVYLKDNGGYEQDIVRVGNDISTDKLGVAQTDGKITVSVWGNADDENYTEKYGIRAFGGIIKPLNTRRNKWQRAFLYEDATSAKENGYSLMYEDDEGSVYGIRDEEREHCWKSIAFVPYEQYLEKYRRIANEGGGN